MTVRLRLAILAPLAVLLVVGLHMVGARPASAAATKPAKSTKSANSTKSTASTTSTTSTTSTKRGRAPHRAPTREPSRAGRGPSSHPNSAQMVRTTSVRARRNRKSTHAGGLVLLVRHAGQTAHAAADPSASIVDFSFSPATITVHVGDTITWTNVGHQPHTATADNHSFDTGVLQHGQSGSHTFTTAGTYTYYCIVHPYMRGTVVVLANATTTTTTTPTTTTPTTTTPTTSSTSGLPNTGLDIAGVVLCGAALTGLGLALRRRLT